MAWTADPHNIWGNRGLGNGFTSRASTRENSISRDASQMPVRPHAEEVEGKSGSGSLIDGSVSLDKWNNRTSYSAKRSLPSGRSLSQAGFPDISSSQQRSFSTAGAPQSLSTASQTFQFTSRPPAVNLGATSTAQQRPTFGTTASSNLTRGSDPPPTVYTKFDRPKDPLKKVDSANGTGPNGFWQGTMRPTVNVSPIDERKPHFATLSRNDSLSASREPSQPPSSRYSDNQSSFQASENPRSAYGTTPSSSRAPSVASQANGSYGGYGGQGGDQFSLHFGQLSMNGNSRPSTSYKPTVPNNGFFNHDNTFNQNFSFGRPAVNGASRGGTEAFEDVEEIDRFVTQHLGPEAYMSPQQIGGVLNDGRTASGNRFMHSPNTTDLRNLQSFRPSTTQTRSSEQNGGLRSASDFHQYANGLIAADRRSPSVVPEPPMYMDPRLEQLLAQQVQRNPYAQICSPYAVPNAVQMPAYFPLVPPLNGVDHYAAARDMPPGDGVQSALMYEFKSNTKTKRYELKDIYDHIAEFAGDQHGSRFIQTKLETANSDEKERVFREIEPNAIQLMTDVFGNYVIQKFFEHGDQTHKKILANKMRGRVFDLSLQMYGCRVVQKALDHVLVDQQALLISELEDYVLQCVKDQNGNHVIQKAIERCPPQTISFIFEAFRGQVALLSIHTYGCRVIQRCLEYCDPRSKNMVLKELMEPQGIPSMISDQYGNYVVQHVISKDHGHGKVRVLDIVLHGLEVFSKHKFASNVVEKCLEQADDAWRRRVVYKLAELNQTRRIEGGEDVFVGLIRDNFGNYVIQKLLDTLCTQDFAIFLELLQPAMTQAKRTGCGKQTQSIEKKMDRYMRPMRFNINAKSCNHNTYQLSLPTPPFSSNFASAANTPPPLTADTQSLQSSAIPSINGDAVEGADRSRKSSEPSNDGRYER